MLCIRSDSDLINNYDEISDYCHKSGDPVFITKNGYGDLVVISIRPMKNWLTRQ